MEGSFSKRPLEPEGRKGVLRADEARTALAAGLASASLLGWHLGVPRLRGLGRRRRGDVDVVSGLGVRVHERIT